MWPVVPLNKILLSEPKLLWEQGDRDGSLSHTGQMLCTWPASTGVRGA